MEREFSIQKTIKINPKWASHLGSGRKRPRLPYSIHVALLESRIQNDHELMLIMPDMDDPAKMLPSLVTADPSTQGMRVYPAGI